MPDNVTLQDDAPATPPDGTAWATREVGGVHYVPGLIVDAGNPSRSLAIDGSGRPTVKQVKGSKTFSDPAPGTGAASIVGANANRVSVTIHNAGTVTVYLGKDNTVSTSNGLPLPPNATLSDEVTTDAWWAIVAAGTGDLRIIEVA